MKTLPTALATHYASGTTTLADLLKITRKDGQMFAFTSASTDVTIGGQLYTSAQGLDISSLEVTAGLAVDNLELTTLDDGTIFSRVEVMAGVWRNADFIISRYNWASPSDGIEVRMVGTVGEVHLKRGSITAELRGLQQYLQQPIGSVTSKTCRARLGDSLCRVALVSPTINGTVTSVTSLTVFTASAMTQAVGFFNTATLTWLTGPNAGVSRTVSGFAVGGVFTLSTAVPTTIAIGNTFSVKLPDPYTFTGSVTASASQQVFTDSTKAQAADYFAEGIVTFTSGVNSGLSQKVKTFTGGVFTLALPMLQTIATGTTYSVVAGCRKRLEDCSGKFNNVLNFQGEPHLPGVDQITAPA